METNTNDTEAKKTPSAGCHPTTCSPSYMSVSYEIVDMEEWRKTNPLQYKHHGLEAVTIATGDVFEKLDCYEKTLEYIAYAGISGRHAEDEARKALSLENV